jgi:hypothetical protein
VAYVKELSQQPPIQWVPGALSQGVKRPWREGDHSLPSSAEVKGVEPYLHSLNTHSWRGAQLKHSDMKRARKTTETLSGDSW